MDQYYDEFVKMSNAIYDHILKEFHENFEDGDKRTKINNKMLEFNEASNSILKFLKKYSQ